MIQTRPLYPPILIHSDECYEWQRQTELAQDDFERHYPRYCRECGGAGTILVPGRHYYPDGSGEPDLWDVCGGCSEQLKCALCGQEAPEECFENWDTILPCGHKAAPDEIYPYLDGPCECAFEWEAEAAQQYG